MVYVVSHHIKVKHVLPRYSACLNLDKEMIVRAYIFHRRSKLKQTQECLDRAYFSWQCGTFKINNALVYHILLKIFTDMDAYANMKHKRV